MMHAAKLRSLALLVIAGVTLWAFWPRSRLLPDLAHRVTSHPFQGQVRDAAWLLNGNVRLVEGVEGRGILPEPHLIELNPRTGEQIDLGDLKRPPFVPRSGTHEASYYSLSPDGKWGLYFDMPPKSQRGLWLARELDGPRRVFWEVNGQLLPVWSVNGREWAEAAWDEKGFNVYCIDDPHPRLVRTHRKIGSYPFWFDGHGRFVSATNFELPSDLRFYETTLSNPPRVRELKIDFPRNSVYVRALLSPREDRVLWTLTLVRDNGTGLPSRLRSVFVFFHLFRKPNAGQEWFDSLWISRPDGSDLHEIGRVDPKSYSDTVEAVAWIPDGKHVSFVYDHDLYILPVE